MLVFCDSFDGPTPGYKWDSVANLTGPSTGYGRFGSKGVQVAGGGAGAVWRDVPINAAFGFLGGAVTRTSNTQTHGIFSVADAATEQADVRITATGAVQLVCNGAQVAISADGVFAVGVMRFLEWKIKIHNTTGETTVKVDGVQVATFTGNTRATANNSFSRIALGPVNSGAAVYYDDFYYCDDTGAQNKTFLGDVRIYNLVPNGNGYLNQWARTGGSASGNYTAVSEVIPDDDTSYVADATVGDIDSYAVTDPSPTPSAILGLMLFSRIRKDDTTARSVAPFIRMGGVNGMGATRVTPATYGQNTDIFELSPATGIAPTPTEVAAMEIGIKVIS